MAGQRMWIKVKLYGGRGLSEDPQEARRRLRALSSFPSEAGVCEAWFWSALRSTEPGSRRQNSTFCAHRPPHTQRGDVPVPPSDVPLTCLLYHFDEKHKKANYNKDPADSG